MQTDVVIRVTVTKPDGIAYYGASFVRVTIGAKIGAKMNDLIRRQDAFRAVLGVTIYDTVDDVEIHCDASVADSEGWLGGVRDALRAIENVPAADPEQKWIPVTEALPEKKEMVLITNNKGHVKCGQYQGIFDDRNRWWWKHNTLEKVLAWMPLPEPYRGE